MDYFYHGKPCKRCGGTARYNSGGCMNCHSRRATREPGNIHGPASFYDGKPCQHCGTTKKYQSDRSCVECKRLRAEARKAKRQQESQNRKKTEPGQDVCRGCGETKNYFFLDYCRKCQAQQRKGWRKEQKQGIRCLHCGETKYYAFNDYCKKCQANEKRRIHGDGYFKYLHHIANNPF